LSHHNSRLTLVEPADWRVIFSSSIWGNYSPPFWEILLDTVTAESPTGEG
jgi:hypothetical protein